MKANDLSGKRIGRWTVVKQEGKNNGDLLWLCKCDCGTIRYLRSSTLNKGYSKSCGCSHYRYNDYIFNQDYVTGILSSGETFIFDKDDYEKVKNIRWRTDKNGYVVSTQGVKIHRLITNCPSGMVIDHINHDIRDNRKENLRICTAQQNKMNTKTKTKNSSGYKGVYYRDKKELYEAYIGYNGKSIYLGSFKNIDDAIKVRKEAEQKYYGEFAYKEG